MNFFKKNHKRSIWIVHNWSVFIFFIAFIGCERDSFQDEEQPEPNTSPSVVVMSDLNIVPFVQEIREDGSIVYKGKEIKNSISEGAIICSAPVPNAPYGYFCKVKSISLIGDNTLVTTEDAILEEAIKEGQFSDTFSIVDSIESITDENGNEIELSKSYPTKIDGSSSVKFPLSIKSQDDGVSYSFNGHIELAGNYHLDLEFADWTLKKFELWEESDFNVSISSEVKAAIQQSLFKKTLFYVHLRPVTVIVFGIPIVIVPTIQVRLESSVDGSVTVGCHIFDYDWKYKAGILYNQLNGWELISDNNSQMPQLFKEWDYFDMKGSIQIGLETSMFPAFYNIKSEKNRIDINASLPLKIEVSDVDALDFFDGYINPKIKASLGTSIGARAKLTILSKRLVSFEPKTKVLEIDLFNKHLYPQFSFDSIEEDFRDNTTKLCFSIINIDDCFFSDLTNYGVYLKSGDWPTNKKDGTEVADSLGSINLVRDASNLLDNKHCFNVSFNGLMPNATYTVRPFSTDAVLNVEHIANAYTFQPSSYEEEELRRVLTQLYIDTQGDNWYRNTNWCTDQPLEYWYGISISHDNIYNLNLSNNNLTGFININDCNLIENIACNNNNLTCISITDCQSLMSLKCDNNVINDLEIKRCDSLMELSFNNNCLSSQDLSGLPSLFALYYDSNLTSLNISNCPSINDIGVYGKLQELDVSFCSGLKNINFYTSNLRVLKAKSCSSIELFSLTAPSELSYLDLANCTSLQKLTFEGIKSLDFIDISGCSSLEDFTGWYCGNLNIDFSKGTSIKSINWYQSEINSISVEGITSLLYLSVDNNTIKTINANGCTALKGLYCNNNKLESLSVIGCSSLEYLSCCHNCLTSLDVLHCSDKVAVDCRDNHIIQKIDREDQLGGFSYDKRYTYTSGWDPNQNKIVYYYIENTYGWYYDGEPEKGYHGR